MALKLGQELKKIADAIRTAKGTTETFKPKNFATEIAKLCYLGEGTSGSIETIEGQTITPTTTDQTIEGNKYLKGDLVVKGDINLKPENIVRGRGSGNYIFNVRGTADRLVDINYEKPIWTGAYANEAVKVARTYWDARVSEKVKFAYSGGDAIFEGKLTDENGNCYIDCSTFINLYLLGIDYNHSPYRGATGQANKTIDPSTIVPRSDYSWNFSSLISQSTNNFASGKIRYAADLAEYFYSQGRVIPIDEVMPGDLTFHASTYDDGTYHINNRFKNISHVGIVAEEKYIERDSTGKVTYFEYYNVTSIENVIVRTRSTARTDIVFCVRPDYRPRTTVSEISSINLIPNTYRSGDIGTTTINDMTFTVADTGKITTSGQPSVGTTFYITNKTYPIYLKKGTYKLTGCPLRSDTTSGETWGLAIRKQSDESLIAWDIGNGVTFTITDDFLEVYIFIYISDLKDATGYIWNPKLIRTA